MHPTDKQSRTDVLEFHGRQENDLEDQLLRWIVGITKSNALLIATLERLRDSHVALLVDRPANASSALLLQVDRVLSEAKKAKTLLMVDLSSESEGA